MRYKVLRTHSSKSERIFYEVLKELKIPFRHRWIVCGKEIDFIVGNYAIEINGHGQDSSKNELLVQAGYIPIHFHNKEVTKEIIIRFFKK